MRVGVISNLRRSRFCPLRRKVERKAFSLYATAALLPPSVPRLRSSSGFLSNYFGLCLKPIFEVVTVFTAPFLVKLIRMGTNYILRQFERAFARASRLRSLAVLFRMVDLLHQCKVEKLEADSGEVRDARTCVRTLTFMFSLLFSQVSDNCHSHRATHHVTRVARVAIARVVAEEFGRSQVETHVPNLPHSALPTPLLLCFRRLMELIDMLDEPTTMRLQAIDSKLKQLSDKFDRELAQLKRKVDDLERNIRAIDRSQ